MKPKIFEKRGVSVVRFSGMTGFDNERVRLMREAELGYFSKLAQTLTGKSVASPYFTANDFEFAYAKA